MSNHKAETIITGGEEKEILVAKTPSLKNIKNLVKFLAPTSESNDLVLSNKRNENQFVVVREESSTNILVPPALDVQTQFINVEVNQSTSACDKQMVIGEADDAFPQNAFILSHEGKDEGIIEPNENDVLNGRGASVNAHKGNTKFRAVCFARKPEFEAGNHAAKRRIAAEIVILTKASSGRFLKRRPGKGPWYELSNEKAVLKACQVMRDFQRPDRLGTCSIFIILSLEKHIL